MSTPTTNNKTADTADTVVNAAGNTITEVVEDLIIADVPALGFPVIKQLWEALFNWISGYYIKAAANGATFLVIDSQTASEESGISAALQAVITAEKTGDASAIKSAIAAYAKAQSALVNSDGSGSS